MTRSTVDPSKLRFLRRMAENQRINAASLPTLLALINIAEQIKPLKKRLKAAENIVVEYKEMSDLLYRAIAFIEKQEGISINQLWGDLPYNPHLRWFDEEKDNG